ncbi:MAG: hypothetical protein PUP46_10130, partial [Endozoicomonas sp. (ex Botrylloides leachii)]|nr:hypothetical protein [Endozoicomonas sp. (ex Botrylloides leachii)]
RIWQETVRALMTSSPAIYFKTLMDCGALRAIMPQTYSFFLPDSPSLLALAAAADNNESAYIRFSCLYPPVSFVSSDQLTALFKHLRFPIPFNERALLINTYLSELISAQQALCAKGLASLFRKMDAFRKPDRFIDTLKASYYLAVASSQPLDVTKQQTVIAALEVYRRVNASDIIAEGYKGKEIGEQLYLKRIQQIAKIKGIT